MTGVHDQHLDAVIGAARHAAIRPAWNSPTVGHLPIDDLAGQAEQRAFLWLCHVLSFKPEDKYPALGGAISAHVIRAHAEASGYPWSLDAPAGALLPRGREGEPLARGRTEAALRVRRTLASTSMPGEVSLGTEAGRLLATWLVQTERSHLSGASGKLARHVAQHAHNGPYAPHLGTGWWAVAGPSLVKTLAEMAPSMPGGGRPKAEDQAVRALLRWATTQVDATGVVTRVWLAERAGITRATLNTWTTNRTND